MPTPIGHAVAGGAAERLTGVRELGGWALVAFVAVVANLPDADYLGGILVDQPRAWHRGATHSITATLLVALVAAAVARRLGQRFWPFFVLTLAVYGSHLVTDAIMPDTHGPAGIPLLWPFTDRHMSAPIPLPAAFVGFLDLRLGEANASFVQALTTWRAPVVFLVEGLLFLPLLLVAHLLRRSRGGSSQGKMPRSR